MDELTLSLFKKLEQQIRAVDLRQGGPRGPKGRKGDKGPKGDQGATGPQGLRGQTGPQGPKGDKGPSGAAGAAGKQGPRGEVGPRGERGSEGPVGPQGPAGVDGVSVVDANIDFDGYLTLSLSNGDLIEAGKVAFDEALEQVVYNAGGGVPDKFKQDLEQVIEDLNNHLNDFNNPHRTTHDNLFDNPGNFGWTENPHETSVENLTDTSIIGPTDGQGLWWDGTKWINRASFTETWPTGLVDGGELNIGPGPNDIEILTGLGEVCDSYTNPNQPPVIQALEWPQINTPITAAPSVAGSIVWFTIYDTGVLSSVINNVEVNLGDVRQYAQRPSPTVSRQEIPLGFAVHNGVGWQEVSNPKVINQSAETLREYVTTVSALTTIIEGGATRELPAFQLQQDAGTVWENNRNWHVDKSDPNREALPAASPITFTPVNRDFTVVGTPTDTIDPDLWDNAGVVEPIPGPSNNATIQRLYLDPGNNYWLLWGQNIYPNFLTAQASISADNANTVVPFLLQNSILLGYAIVENAKPDWDPDEAVWLPAGEGGTGGSGGGTPITDHNNLNGIGPDDHHNQVHLLYGPDHSDVNSGGTPTLRDGLFFNGTDFSLERRMDWRGLWVAGPTYEEEDVVRDQGYLAVALTQTTDRPAPVANGDPSYPTEGAVWDENLFQTNSVVFGNRYTNLLDVQVTAVRLVVVPFNVGLVHAVTLTVDGTIAGTATVTPGNAGVTDFPISPVFYRAGSELLLTCRVINNVGNQRVYVPNDVDFWVPVPAASGFLDGVLNDNAYGVDALSTPISLSPDWAILSSPIGAGGGGGGEFTPTIFQGAGTTGYVPDPLSETGKVLLDDGTWTNTIDGGTF